MPNLNISIEDGQPLTIKIKNVPSYWGNNKKEISMSDVPVDLFSYVSQTDINEYNASLPTEDEVKAHNQQFALYWAKKSAVLFDFENYNDGIKPANEIYCNIYLPDRLVFIKKRDSFPIFSKLCYNIGWLLDFFYIKYYNNV